MMRLLIITAVMLAALSLLPKAATAERVNVKYRGPVNLTPFTCEAITRSSLIKRVCYDAANHYMIIKLRQTYYHYCEIDAGTVAALRAAESMGRYYSANIKGSGLDGPFDCRTHRVPNYLDTTGLKRVEPYNASSLPSGEPGLAAPPITGLFDDLIPQAPAPAAPGIFDDLIPKAPAAAPPQGIPNPFDQFDSAPVQLQYPFDQFDAPVVPQAPAPAPPQEAPNPFDALPDEVPPPTAATSISFGGFLPPTFLAGLIAAFSIARFETQRWVRARLGGRRGSSELWGAFVDATFGIASTFGIVFLAALLWDYGWQTTASLIAVSFASSIIWSFLMRDNLVMSIVASLACWPLMLFLGKQVSWFGLLA